MVAVSLGKGVGGPPGSVLEKALVSGPGGGSGFFPRSGLEKPGDPLRCRGTGPPLKLRTAGPLFWACCFLW
jgi:hypothetical protein